MAADFEIIHQAGDRNIQQVKKEAEGFPEPEIKSYYHTFPFLSETQLKDAYARPILSWPEAEREQFLR